MQNVAPTGFSAPQLGHVGASVAPQDMQKRARAGLDAAQLGQVLPSVLPSIDSEDRPSDRNLPLKGLRYSAAPLRRGMPNRIRYLVTLALALAAAAALGACGGSSNNEDPQQVLQQTFSNPTSIHSGTFDLDVKLETSGGDNPGKVEVKLGGRFQSSG